MDDSPWDAIFVGPTCHVQTADKRFGPHVLPDIRAFVYSTFTTSFDDDDDDDDDDDNDDDDNDDDDLLGDLGDLDDMGVVGAGGGASTANNNDDLSDLNVPFEFLEGYNMPNDAMSDAGDHAHDLEAGGEHPTFPKVARVRSNLTCLSQRYNLYFAAYQDKIHVFQPQKAPQILPPPCLVLHPPRSRAAQFVGGTIDQMFGHQVNHIIAGDFGDLEILLMCYDDGDVVAYYTHLIAYAIQQTATGRHQHHHHPQHHHHHHPPPHSHGHHHATAAAAAGRAAPVRPFFVDNVGLSAWGLAIHKESRLLAVSCNRHDVTVFAFSLSSSGSGTGTRDGYWADPASSPQVWSGQTALELERHFRSRTRNWRIVLPLGPEGNNIPSIAFVDDEEGNADKIAAVDIVGNTWILNIWQIGGFPALYPPTPSRGADNPR
ncbi:hypothetical protein VTK73DRAFT_2738 [Phialemonium thermophilum]|uniref:Uncharacterized protein n=1 Tax=Phialemonium thermophilum TaxID=223376 RepID=A0ABR3VPF1_9PEZI